MARTELNTQDVKTEQKAPVDLDKTSASNRESDIVKADASLTDEYAAELAFNEEPVTIYLQPATDKNAASVHPVWVNGKGGEVFLNGRWEIVKYLPVGQDLIIKRKYLEVLLRAKQDTVTHKAGDTSSENPENRIVRMTSSACNLSIRHDANPKGAPWASELLRRNY